MPPALRDWFIVATLLVIVWRLLPAAQAFVATVMCAGALWLAFHPLLTANILTQVVRLY